MSWIQKLCDTYDYAVTTEAVTDAHNPLPEVGFVRENVAIEVTLSAEGNFIDAEVVSEERQETVIPCTLVSGMARQGTPKLHPIVNSVEYLGTEDQLNTLETWCRDSNVPREIMVLRKYLVNGTLQSDLENSLLKKGCKWSLKDNVRFCIIDGSLEHLELCQRNNVKQSWRTFFNSEYLVNTPNQVCYVTGKLLPVAVKHPYISGSSILIPMSKGKCGGNCVGHFEGEPQEAVSVSCEATIKAHNAWKWLAARQGTHVFGMTFAAWDTRGFQLPNPAESNPEEDEEDEEGEPRPADTKVVFGNSVAGAVGGYWSCKLKEYAAMEREELSTVVLMAIDSATGKGRASIVYYQELGGKDYLENLMYWYQSCKWTIGRTGKDGKYSYRLRTPLPREICDLLYGKGSNEGQKKLKKQLTKQLLPCITLRRPIPRNLAGSVFHKAINPLSYKDKNQRWDERTWREAVGIACALSRKFYYDKGDEHSMALNKNDQDRNYLYGRLLAVADIIEKEVQRQGGNSRTTNAMRYMQRFQQRPYDAWITLRVKLEPYINRLSSGQQSWYRHLLSEIESMFRPEEMLLAQPLNVRFLEGYSCQITDQYKSKKADAANRNQEE